MSLHTTPSGAAALEEAIAQTLKDIHAAGMLPIGVSMHALMPLQSHLSALLKQRAALLDRMEAFQPPAEAQPVARFTPSDADRHRCDNCGLRIADHVPDEDGARCKREAVRQLREVLAPPAEAQAHGGGEAGILRTAAEYHYAQAACPRDQFGNTSNHRNPRLEAWHRQVADAITAIAAPPSAPVGVELPEGFALNLSVAEATLRKLVAVCPVTPPEAAAIRSVIIGARALALAQQPAPSAPVGVETLTSALQSMRDRLMTALPPKFGDAFDGDFDTLLEAINALRGSRGQNLEALAQQPAAVDGGKVAVRESKLRYCIRELNGARQGDNPQQRAEIVYGVLTAALAAQPGGSDNGR